MIDFVNYLGLNWAKYYFLASFQNSVFLVLIFLMMYFLKNNKARIRYSIALVGLIKFLVPPFIPLPFFNQSNPSLNKIGSIFIIESVPSSISTSLGAQVSLTLAGVFFLLWILLTSLFLFFMLFSSFKLSALLKSAQPVDNVPPAHRNVQIFKSNHIQIPVTIGIFPTKIFVPTSWDRWSEECRNMIIAHELAHIQRYDGVVQVIQMLVLALNFYNPLVWFLNRKINELREMSCDDLTVNGNKVQAVKYFQYLVNIAEDFVQNRISQPVAVMLFRRRKSLQKRINYQVGDTKMKHLSKKALWILVIGMIFLMAPFSVNFKEAKSAYKVSQDKKIVEIVVKNENDIRVDNERANLDNLREKLNKVIQGVKEDIIVEINCSKNVMMGTVSSVQNVLRELELLKIQYITGEGKGSSLILPPQQADVELEHIPTKNILNINIDQQGKVTINEKKVTANQIVQVIRKQLMRNDKLIVKINMHDRTDYTDYIEVLNKVKEAGAKRIAVVK